MSSVCWLCATLDVTPGGFYTGLQRPESERAPVDRLLLGKSNINGLARLDSPRLNRFPASGCTPLHPSMMLTLLGRLDAVGGLAQTRYTARRETRLGATASTAKSAT